MNLTDPRPLVSIIITSYNRVALLPRSIESVLNQSYPNIEIIVVDDGSKDGTHDYLKTVNDPRISVYIHKANYGQNASLNTGVCFASGSYIGFNDHDDVLLPTFIERFIDKFNSDPEFGAVYCPRYFKGAGRDAHLAIKFHLEGYIYPESLAQGYLSHMGTLMVKRDCFKKTRLFDINFTNAQDDDFCFLIAKNYKVGLISEPLAIEYGEVLEGRVTSNKLDYANGFRMLIQKHHDDIISLAGYDAWLNHCIKSGRLYTSVHQFDVAKKLIDECTEVFNMIVENKLPLPPSGIANLIPSRAELRDNLLQLIDYYNATAKLKV